MGPAPCPGTGRRVVAKGGGKKTGSGLPVGQDGLGRVRPPAPSGGHEIFHPFRVGFRCRSRLFRIRRRFRRVFELELAMPPSLLSMGSRCLCRPHHRSSPGCWQGWRPGTLILNHPEVVLDRLGCNPPSEQHFGGPLPCRAGLVQEAGGGGHSRGAMLPGCYPHVTVRT
jgi:hypothetical protein